MNNAIILRASVFLVQLVLLPVWGQDKPAVITEDLPLQTLLRSPQAFDAATVQVRGRLRFAGRDYFVDPVFVIEDSLGNQVRVSPWLPLEIPPLPPDVPQTTAPPKTMRDYLGHTFTVEGIYFAAEHSIAVSAAFQVDGTASDGRTQALSPWNKALPTEGPRRDRKIDKLPSAAPLPASSGKPVPDPLPAKKAKVQ